MGLLYICIALRSRVCRSLYDRPGLIIEARDVLERHHSKQLQYNEDDNDDEQNMYPIAGLRESWADVPAESAEQPQD